MLGDKGIGVEMTSSVWVPRGRGYRSCLSKTANAHQREPGDHDHEGKSKGFLCWGSKNRTIYPSLASKGEERRGHRPEKD